MSNQLHQQAPNLIGTHNPNINYGNPIMNKFTENHMNLQMQNNPYLQAQQKDEKQAEIIEDKNEINLEYLNGLEDNEAKTEYLGEIIFKKIENHHLAQKYEFDINKIGKTTGMILALDDINYIIDICKNEDNLGSYILESHKLLKESEN